MLGFISLCNICIFRIMVEEINCHECLNTLGQRILHSHHLIKSSFVKFNIGNSQVQNILLRKKFRFGCCDREFGHGVIVDVGHVLSKSKLFQIFSRQYFLRSWKFFLKLSNLSISWLLQVFVLMNNLSIFLNFHVKKPDIIHVTFVIVLVDVNLLFKQILIPL